MLVRAYKTHNNTPGRIRQVEVRRCTAKIRSHTTLWATLTKYLICSRHRIRR